MEQWGKAVRYGALALTPIAKRAGHAARALPLGRKDGGGGRSLKDRLNPASSEKGGRAGDAADAMLAKLGTPGKLASKMSLGSRAVERILPGGAGASSAADPAKPKVAADHDGSQSSNGHRTAGPVPIQESIEVAVPLRAAYALATRFEAYPEFLDRVDSAELLDDGAAFEAHVHGTSRTVKVELVDEVPEARIEWRTTEGLEYSGVASFHELAPRLTHIELSVEPESESVIQRVTRSAHLTQHAIRSDLHRFKAWAELWQDEEEIAAGEEAPAAEEEPNQPDEREEDEEEPDEDEIVDEEEDVPADEDEDVDEEVVDEYEDDEDEEGEEDEDEEVVDEYEDEEDEDEEDEDEIVDEEDEEEPENAYSEALEDYEPTDAYEDVLEEDEPARA
jgi:uncharacterized membrane protein